MAYPNCERCFRLWAEYDVAVKVMLEAASDDNAATLEVILSRIEAHESEAHPRAKAADSFG